MTITGDTELAARLLDAVNIIRLGHGKPAKIGAMAAARWMVAR
ncbi:hypothetical protein [Nocardia gipuzkoensis]